MSCGGEGIRGGTALFAMTNSLSGICPDSVNVVPADAEMLVREIGCGIPGETDDRAILILPFCDR